MQDNKNISNNKYKNVLANSFICWRSSLVAPEKSKTYLVIIPNRNLGYDTLTYELTVMNYYTKENSDNGEAFWRTYRGNDNDCLPSPILWADIDAQNVIEGVINNYALELIEQENILQEKVLEIINESQEAEKIIDKTLTESLIDKEITDSKKIDDGLYGEVGTEFVVGQNKDSNKPITDLNAFPPSFHVNKHYNISDIIDKWKKDKSMKEYYDSYMVYKEKLYIYEVVENNPCASVNDIDTAKKELDDSLWNWFMKCYSALGANNGVSIDGFHGEIVCYSYNLMWGGRVLFSWHYSFNNYPNNWNETIGNKLIKFGENEWKRKLE